MELRGPADVAQPTFALFDRLGAESVAIEEPRAVEVRCGELGHGMRRGEWAYHDWTSFSWFYGVDPSRDRARIRQIENQSLKKLQSLAEAQKLRDVA